MIISPWLKKIMEIGILKGCRLTQFYLLMLKILDSILLLSDDDSFTMFEENFENCILKGYRLTQFYYSLDDDSFTMVEENFENWYP